MRYVTGDNPWRTRTSTTASFAAHTSTARKSSTATITRSTSRTRLAWSNHARPARITRRTGRSRRPRIQNAHGDALRQVLEVANIDPLVFAQRISLVRDHVGYAVGEHHDVDWRKHQVLSFH